MAFDRSRSRWLGISDLIAEPNGPSSSPVQSRILVWTGDARDTRLVADVPGPSVDNERDTA
jgi:hypothetical protein